MATDPMVRHEGLLDSNRPEGNILQSPTLLVAQLMRPGLQAHAAGEMHPDCAQDSDDGMRDDDGIGDDDGMGDGPGELCACTHGKQR